MKTLAAIIAFLGGFGLFFPLVLASASPTEGFAETPRHQEVQVGKEFRITVQSNRTTGYQWKLAQPLDQAVVKMMSSQYVGPAKQIPGAGGKEVWVFQAVGRGTAEIHLEYVRPWEKGEAPARTATYSILVK
jgi:inhibitor of cysteine peptidase